MGIPQNYENLLVDNVRLRAEAEAKGLCKPWAPEPIGADAFTERGESGEQLNRAIVRDRRKKEKIAMVECVKSAHSRLHKYTPEELAQMDGYHAKVLATVGPLVEPDVRAWLEAACAPL